MHSIFLQLMLNSVFFSVRKLIFGSLSTCRLMVTSGTIGRWYHMLRW